MLIRIQDPTTLPELVVFLRNSGFRVMRGDEAEVRAPGADAQLLEPVLAIWNELHKEAKAEIASQGKP
jgi:hypothetical protein